MAQVTMYPANPGSPETTTSSETAIDATSIDITELGSLLAATNQCVLTDGTDYEVVVYTAKSAASGAGTITVTRSGTGHEGTAKVWPSGTAVYNSPTAYIFNCFKANIEDLDTSRQPNRNIVINGGFSVAQRGTAFTSASVPANSDDTYLLDQWILLSDGNDVVDVSQVAGAFSRSQYGLKAEVETANKKFGFIQLLEASTCIPLRGQTISLSFAAKTETGKVINNVRAAVLEWTGTADAVTSDVVNAWSNQGTNPTLVANWAALNTAANLALSTSETTYKIEGITVGASCNNLAVFVWIDDTDAAVDDLLYLGEVQLVRGSVAPPFVAKTYAEELRACQRYFEKSYAAGTAIAANTGLNEGIHDCMSDITTPHTVRFAVSKRAAPTMSIYDAVGNANKVSTGENPNVEFIACDNISEGGFKIFTGLTAHIRLSFHWVASAEL